MLTFLVRTCTDDTESVSIVKANSKDEALKLLFDEPDFSDDEVLYCVPIDTLTKGVQYIISVSL